MFSLLFFNRLIHGQCVQLGKLNDIKHYTYPEALQKADTSSSVLYSLSCRDILLSQRARVATVKITGLLLKIIHQT